MNLIDAIRSGRPLRRPTTGFFYDGASGRSHVAPGTWMSPDYLIRTLRLSKEDILADDWEIQEPTVTITRTQFLNAAGFVREGDRWHYIGEAKSREGALAGLLNLARKLGLEP